MRMASGRSGRPRPKSCPRIDGLGAALQSPAQTVFPRSLTTGALTLTLTTARPGTNFDTTLYVLTGCPIDASVALGCNDDAPDQRLDARPHRHARGRLPGGTHRGRGERSRRGATSSGHPSLLQDSPCLRTVCS